MGTTPPPSFGRSRPEPEIPAVPMMPYLGQIAAELVITVNEESLREAGNAIATMVANATIQGYAAGWEFATGEPFQAPTPDGPVKAGADVSNL